MGLNAKFGQIGIYGHMGGRTMAKLYVPFTLVTGA